MGQYLYDQARNIKKRLSCNFNSFAKFIYEKEYADFTTANKTNLNNVRNESSKNGRKKKKKKRKGTTTNDDSTNDDNEVETDNHNSDQHKKEKKKSNKRRKKYSDKDITLDMALDLEVLSKEIRDEIISFHYSHKFDDSSTKTVHFTTASLDYLIQKAIINEIRKPTILSCIIGIQQKNAEIFAGLRYKSPAYDDLRAIILLSPSGSEYIIDSDDIDENIEVEETNKVVDTIFDQLQTMFLELNPEWESINYEIIQEYGDDTEVVDYRKVYSSIFI